MKRIATLAAAIALSALSAAPAAATTRPPMPTVKPVSTAAVRCHTAVIGRSTHPAPHTTRYVRCRVVKVLDRRGVTVAPISSTSVRSR